MTLHAAEQRAAAARRAARGDFTMPRELASARLALRAIGPEHEADFVRFWTDADSARFVGGARTVGDAWRLLAAHCGQWTLHGFGLYGLHEAGGACLGHAGLWFPAEWPEIEISYGLMPGGRGRGLAAEAVRAVREAAIAGGAPSLVSYIAPDNLASQRVAAAAGAVQEARIALMGRPAAVFRYPVAPGHGARAAARTAA